MSPNRAYLYSAGGVGGPALVGSIRLQGVNCVQKKIAQMPMPSP